MKKQTILSWLTAAITFAATLVAFCLRRVQLLRELLPDGSLAEGSSLWLFLAVLSGVFVVALVALLLPMEKLPRSRDVFTVSALPNLLQILAAAALLAGNILLLFGGSVETPVVNVGLSKALTFLLPLLGIAAAICLAAFAVICSGGRAPSPLLFMCTTVYLAIRLLIQFQRWNADPSIHDYCYSFLAAIFGMLAAFYLAGFGFDKGKRRITLFWTLSALVFFSIQFADALHSGVTSDILIGGALLLTMAINGGRLLFGKAEH